MPGLLRGVARTAVIAGTASAVSGRVQRRQASRFAEQGRPDGRAARSRRTRRWRPPARRQTGGRESTVRQARRTSASCGTPACSPTRSSRARRRRSSPVEPLGCRPPPGDNRHEETRHAPLPADRRPRADRRPADRRAGDHRRLRSTGSARPGSTRPACSARCSTTSAAGTSGSVRALDVFTSKQLYFPDTAVLVTRFMTEDGVGEVVDFMPITEQHAATDRHRLVRMVRCVRGQMTLRARHAPRGSTTAASRTRPR